MFTEEQIKSEYVNYLQQIGKSEGATLKYSNFKKIEAHLGIQSIYAFTNISQIEQWIPVVKASDYNSRSNGVEYNAIKNYKEFLQNTPTIGYVNPATVIMPTLVANQQKAAAQPVTFSSFTPRVAPIGIRYQYEDYVKTLPLSEDSKRRLTNFENIERLFNINCIYEFTVIEEIEKWVEEIKLYDSMNDNHSKETSKLKYYCDFLKAQQL